VVTIPTQFEMTPRKIFSVIINKKEYDVYDIYGKEHEGYNDTPKTWWLYHSEKLPDELLPPHDSPNFIPWNASIERLCWELKFTQRTTTKEKWDETRFSNHTHCEIWCNNRLVYAFGSGGGDRGLAFAIAKAQYMQTVLCEHPYNFLDPEQENGRKVCWYGLPATIRVKSDTWEIAIIPDYTAGINEEDWWKELHNRINTHTEQDQQDKEMDQDDWEETRASGYINWGDAFSDAHIYWFRK